MAYKDKARLGFTLLEVILAVSIISIALTIIINSFSLIARSKVTTSNYTKAVFLLEEALHNLKTKGFSKYSQEGTFKSPFEQYSWYMESEAVTAGELRRVLLAIFWKERNQKKELKIITYLRQESQ
jgi:prepilin-type N-terminal cleavage/methylation domain-containing protein